MKDKVSGSGPSWRCYAIFLLRGDNIISLIYFIYRLQMKSKFLVFLQANMKATGIKVVTDGVSDMEVKEEE